MLKNILVLKHELGFDDTSFWQDINH
jgi:hypothetical protein